MWIWYLLGLLSVAIISIYFAPCVRSFLKRKRDNACQFTKEELDKL